MRGAPLGGQNFLEPLACGVTPVIGPSWHNFHWVGEAIFTKGLVHRAADSEVAADYMIQGLKNPIAHTTVRRRALQFAQNRTGGTQQACAIISGYLI